MTADTPSSRQDLKHHYCWCGSFTNGILCKPVSHTVHCSGLSTHHTWSSFTVPGFGCCWQGSCACAMGSLRSKLRRIAAMNISEGISSTRVKGWVSTSVENCIHDTNYSQMKFFIKSRPHMIQYSFYWKLTQKKSIIFLVISIYHQLSLLFNSNLSSAPPTSLISAAINVRLLCSHRLTLLWGYNRYFWVRGGQQTQICTEEEVEIDF